MIKLKKFYLDICKRNFENGYIKFNVFMSKGLYVYLTDGFTTIKLTHSLFQTIINKNIIYTARASIDDTFLYDIYNTVKSKGNDTDERTFTITKDAIDKVYAYSKVTKNHKANINNEIVIDINFLKGVTDMINEPSITVNYHTSANPEDTTISALTITSDAYSDNLEIIILPICFKTARIEKTHSLEVQ